MKKFGELTAVAEVDLDIEAGEWFGLLGPNGAGLTSLVRMISAVSPITQGRHVGGCTSVREKPREIKALLGTAP